MDVPAGPWWLDRRHDGVGTAWTGSRAICARCPDTGNIDTPVFVAHTTRGWGDEGEANARLIAAAPDLYAALRACLEAVRGVHDGTSELPTEDWRWWDIGWDALTKAEARDLVVKRRDS